MFFNYFVNKNFALADLLFTEYINNTQNIKKYQYNYFPDRTLIFNFLPVLMIEFFILFNVMIDEMDTW